ncbi:hypothetical protein KP79_PYT16412 [Mizuhopecten yessoensis]|uniref:Uncharacterized protein n=1 Tax=Mizuhopecten yessoensis TaxID=6573 RepID=A0A210Q0H4_MIZYE|nr:hypothetical protein KP79_PYT16412 [Mizuhopecten yessoensis]
MKHRQGKTVEHKSQGVKENGFNSNCRNRKWKHNGVSKEVQDPTESQSETGKIFPNWSPWILYAITLVIRATYINRKSNWWIYHPDEIYQSIEVGFSEASGYGFRTYEYLPPPVNVTTSVEEQEVTNGMFSMRSFIFPLFYTFVFKMAAVVGYDYNPYLLGRLFHVIITSLLPVKWRTSDKGEQATSKWIYTRGVLLGGFVDKQVYGTWFLSPLQWYRINLKTNIPSILFGTSSFDVYVDGIFLQSWFTMSYATNTYFTFPSINDNPNTLATKRKKESAEVNACLEFISRQSHVSGVFVDVSLYQMAGLSIIKHNVPLVILIHNEYHEYPNVTSSFMNKPGIRVINRFSDFIHSSNIVYLTKHLLGRMQYSYIVTNRIRESSFGEIGFKTVFSFGAHIVLHRALSSQEKELSQKYAINLLDGDNATVLEYEASWLFTAGLYSKSIHRAESALQVNDQRIRPFQIIGLSYVRLNQWEDARKTEQLCFKRHGEAKCRKPQSRVVIHEEYIPFDDANSYKWL